MNVGGAPRGASGALALDAIFTPEVLDRLRSRAAPESTLARRLDVLSAHGDDVDGRAWRAAWESYASTAASIGLLDDPHGRDLLARLRSPDESNFRGAMAECMVCFLLHRELRLPVSARPAGRPGKTLELAITRPEGDILVEVKARLRDPEPRERVIVGNDSDLLRDTLELANKQFEKGCRNLLVLVPRLRVQGTLLEQLREALYVEDRVAIPIDLEIGGPAGEPYPLQVPNGSFLRRWPTGGAVPQAEAAPRYKRISAVLCVDEGLEAVPLSLTGEAWVGRAAWVLHNPNAEVAIPEALFATLPQFVVGGNEMVWTRDPK